jgi:hypothetical protein
VGILPMNKTNLVIDAIAVIMWTIFASIIVLYLAADAGAASYQMTIELKWQASVTPPAVSGYYVYRNKQRIQQLPATQTTYRDTVSGAVGEVFCYSISAFNMQFIDNTGAVQETPQSSESCQTITVPAQPPPNPPTGFTTTPISASQIQASWNDNSDNEAKFTVVRKQFRPPRTLMFDVPANETTVTDTDLRRARTYCYNVYAVGFDGALSPPSNESCSTTKG